MGGPDKFLLHERYVKYRGAIHANMDRSIPVPEHRPWDDSLFVACQSTRLRYRIVRRALLLVPLQHIPLPKRPHSFGNRRISESR